MGFPTVLGHEGAGVVESVGPGVTDFKPGHKRKLTITLDQACLTYRPLRKMYTLVQQHLQFHFFYLTYVMKSYIFLFNIKIWL